MSIFIIYQAIVSFAMVDLAKGLAKRLRELRGEQTQRAFARKLGIDQAALNRIEQSKENITLATIQKICNNLKCKVSWLFGEGNGD